MPGNGWWESPLQGGYMSWGEGFKMAGLKRKAADQNVVSKKVEGGGKGEGGHQSKVMHTAEDEA